jgi:hypothetical protein
VKQNLQKPDKQKVKQGKTKSDKADFIIEWDEEDDTIPERE